MELMVMGVFAVGCALVLEACGGSAGYNPAAATNPSTNSPLRLSQCMHSHGIKNFPDPTFPTGSGAAGKVASGPPAGVDPSSPAFKQAVSTCGGGRNGGFQVPG